MNYTEIEILRGIVKEELNVSARPGIVDKVADNYVNVRIGHATVLRRLDVIGDISYLEAGSSVLVLSITGENYCLSSGVFSGATNLPSGASSYSLGSQYYDKTEVNDLLTRKSDAGHAHRYDHLEAITGTLGGFEVGADYIRSALGDFAITSNPLATRMVMGSGTDVIVQDAKHATYRLWAGDDDPASAPFSVEKDGKIHASAGDIAGWDILTDRLSKNSVEILPDGMIKLGTGNDVAIMATRISAAPTDWRLWIGHETPGLAPFRVDKYGNATLESATIALTLESDNFETGVRGWKLWNTGEAELQNIVVRGRIEASVFAETTISGVSGQMLISLGDVLVADCEATATTITVASDILGANDIVHFRPSGKEEWMRITTGATDLGSGSGPFQYGVERDYSGAGSESFEAGTACMRKGSSGDARDPQGLAAGAGEGAFGALQPGGGGGSSAGGWLVLDGSSSALSVITRQGPVWNQFGTTVRIGNLSGFLDYSEEIYGLAIGDENDFMTYDEVNGLRIQFIGSAYDTSISGSGFETELMVLQEIAEPPTGTPPANHVAIFADTVDGELKAKFDDATVINLTGYWNDDTVNLVPKTITRGLGIGSATEFDHGGINAKAYIYHDQSGTYKYLLTAEAEGGNGIFQLNSYGNSAAYGAGFVGRHARGTRGTRVAVNASDRLAFYLGGGLKDAATDSWYNTAGFVVYATQNWTNTAAGSAIVIEATPIGGVARVAQLVVYGDRTDVETYFAFKAITAPGTADSGYGNFYVDIADKLPYYKDDSGEVHGLVGGGGADILEVQVFI